MKLHRRLVLLFCASVLALPVHSRLTARAADQPQHPFTVKISGYEPTMQLNSSSLKETDRAKVSQLIKVSEVLAKPETMKVDFLQGAYPTIPTVIEVTSNGEHHIAAFTTDELPQSYKELVSAVKTMGIKSPPPLSSSKTPSLFASTYLPEMSAAEKEQRTAKALERLNDKPFQLTMKQTGGISGGERTYTVDSAKLSKEVRQKFVQALADSGLLALGCIRSKGHFTVSDGFHETIRFEFDGSVHSAQYDSPGGDKALQGLGNLIVKYDTVRASAKEAAK